MASFRAAIGTYTGEYATIVKQVEGIQKDLKMARSERIKRVDDAKTTFSGLLKLLMDDEQRKQVGTDAEIMKMAMENSRNKLAQYHKYEDGKVDQPFLNHETLVDDES